MQNICKHLGLARSGQTLVRSSRRLITLCYFLYIFLKTDFRTGPLRWKPGTPLFLYTFGAEGLLRGKSWKLEDFLFGRDLTSSNATVRAAAEIEGLQPDETSLAVQSESPGLLHLILLHSISVLMSTSRKRPRKKRGN